MGNPFRRLNPLGTDNLHTDDVYNNDEPSVNFDTLP